MNQEDINQLSALLHAVTRQFLTIKGFSAAVITSPDSEMLGHRAPMHSGFEIQLGAETYSVMVENTNQ